ncbi:DUF6059 family protein [Streptomyces goshikiensis]|uniref:DUF6059 family protein n=1 Tax=Streptomyces goshikiensis TaxID=1942 RepID=UPI0037D7BEA7
MRFLRAVWDALTVFGALSMQGYGVVDPPVEGPPAGHPERVTPEVPLTRLERELAAELAVWGSRGSGW